MSRSLHYIFPAGNTTDVFTTVDIGAAATLVLNGNLVDKSTNTVNFLKYGYSRQLSCTTTQANNVIFTINGTQNGVALSENLTVNNTTAYSVQVYDVVTSISINRDATGVSVGTGYIGFFPLTAINLERDVINYTLSTARLTAASIQTTIYNTVSDIALNGRTFLDQVTNNQNLFSIKASSADNQFILPVANAVLCRSILIYINGLVGGVGNSIEMNFIQI